MSISFSTPPMHKKLLFLGVVPKPAAIKAFFLGRQMREKMLLVGLIAFAVVMWGSSVGRRFTAYWRGFSQTSGVLADQRGWLARKDSVEAEVHAAVQHLDPARTFDAVKLQAEMDAIARSTGVGNTSGDDVKTDRSSQFSVNSMQFTIRNVEYAALVRFYVELSKRAPYIGIKQIRIQSNTANPSQLSVALRVSSVEIAR